MSLIAAFVGGLLIVGAVVSYTTDQTSHRSPLDIPTYPNAVFWGKSEVKPTSQNLFYRVSDAPEKVASYYQQKMVEHYGNNEQGCVRLPATGNAPGSDTNPNISPYIFRCMFDNSGFNTSQFTQVEIYPGEENSDPFFNAKGLTIVKYEQQWQN
ncbi:MAG: hypothetical protein ABI835_17470 [Chloroflexota bacterium]